MTSASTRVDASRVQTPSFFHTSYQACRSGLVSFAQTVLAKPVQFGIAQARKVTIFDIGFIFSLRTINGISSTLFKKQPFNPDALVTKGQERQAQELAALRERLSKKPGTLAFGAAVKTYLHDLIPSIVATKLHVIPQALENWSIYKMCTMLPYYSGYPLAYTLNQINRHTHFREALLESEPVQQASRWFKGVCTTASHALLHQRVINSMVSLEKILLNLLNKGHGPTNPKKMACMQQAILASLATSFSQQSEVDAFLVEKFCKPPHPDKQRYEKAEIKAMLEKDGIKALMSKAGVTPSEALIARIVYHTENKTLPLGIPNPKLVSLTPENLSQELRNSLNSFVSELVQKILDFETPKSLKEGLIGTAYFLEGKKLLNEILTFIIVEIGIEQLVDPYMLSVAILLAMGHETMELEVDGFGTASRLKILETGKDILKASLLEPKTKEPSATEPTHKEPVITSGYLLKIFEKSGLRHAGGGLSAIRQKMDAKAALKEEIKKGLYSYKDEQFKQADSWEKTVREITSRLPLVGPSILVAQSSVRLLMFSLSYMRRGANNLQISFWEWMLKNFMGEDLCEFLATRIVDLIYHPSWRITLMQLISTIVEQFKTPEDKLPDPAKGIIKDKESFKKVATFILQELLGGTALSGTAKLFKADINEWITYFSGDVLYTQFQAFLAPKEGNPSPIESILTALTPTLRELTLYKRVADIFREKGLHFKDDGKFWEMYVREYLYDTVNNEFYEERKAKQIQEQEKLDKEHRASTALLRRSTSPKKELQKAPLPPPPTPEEITSRRNQLVTDLLDMDSKKLRQKLADTKPFFENEQDWHKMVQPATSATTSTHPPAKKT